MLRLVEMVTRKRHVMPFRVHLGSVKFDLNSTTCCSRESYKNSGLSSLSVMDDPLTLFGIPRIRS